VEDAESAADGEAAAVKGGSPGEAEARFVSVGEIVVVVIDAVVDFVRFPDVLITVA